MASHMAAHHRPAERSGRRARHRRRTASTSTPPSGAAATRALILVAAVAAGPPDRLRPGPAKRCGRDAGATHRRPALLDPAHRASRTWRRRCRRAASRRCTACCSTWASARRRSTTPRAASVSASTARSTCAWTPTRGESAAEWLARADERHIAEVIRDYGEERFAVQIAKAIVARRQERGPVRTTAELAELVAGAVKTREPGQNPATRTFQALRIFVNAELEELNRR